MQLSQISFCKIVKTIARKDVLDQQEHRHPPRLKKPSKKIMTLNKKVAGIPLFDFWVITNTDHNRQGISFSEKMDLLYKKTAYLQAEAPLKH